MLFLFWYYTHMNTIPQASPRNPFKFLVVLFYGSHSWLVRRGHIVTIVAGPAARHMRFKHCEIYQHLEWLKDLGLLADVQYPMRGQAQVTLLPLQDTP